MKVALGQCQGGKILALYEGGAAGDTALEDAVREAQGRNATIDVVGFLPRPFAIPAGFFALHVAPFPDRCDELTAELEGAVRRVPPDLSVGFRIIRGDPFALLDLGDYIVVTGRRQNFEPRLSGLLLSAIGAVRRWGLAGLRG